MGENWLLPGGDEARAERLPELPVATAPRDLPGYLESVARFADAVVALDDGSTDDTRELLDAHPLGQVVLATRGGQSTPGGTTPRTATGCSTPRPTRADWVCPRRRRAHPARRRAALRAFVETRRRCPGSPTGSGFTG